MRLSILFLAVLPAFGQWPQFRGPNGSGVAAAHNLPVEFGPEKNALWKVELPAGHSSPVISGGRIFITAVEGESLNRISRDKVADSGQGKLWTICLDQATGKTLWRSPVPRPRREQYQVTNSAASPSPVTDGRNVYVFFGDFGLVAFDRSGKEQWRLPLGPFNNMNGHGTSPILEGDLLLLVCDQDSGSPARRLAASKPCLSEPLPAKTARHVMRWRSGLLAGVPDASIVLAEKQNRCLRSLFETCLRRLSGRSRHSLADVVVQWSRNFGNSSKSMFQNDVRCSTKLRRGGAARRVGPPRVRLTPGSQRAARESRRRYERRRVPAAWHRSVR